MFSFGSFIVLVLSVQLSEVITKPMQEFDHALLRKRMDFDGATSFVYRSDNNGPAQIYYLTGDGLSKHFPSYKPSHQREVVPYVYSKPYASAYPISHYPPKAKSEPSVPFLRSETTSPIYSSEITYPMTRSQNVEPVQHTSSEERADHSGDDSWSSSEESGEGGRDYSGSHETDHHKGHLEEGGHSQEEKYKKKNGKESNKDYKKEFKFSKGKKGSYNREHNGGDFGEDGGKKSSHYDEHKKQSEHESEGKHEKGGKFDAKKHHKKGSKSKGYHNVFMKDEYKKDHTFYGENDKT